MRQNITYTCDSGVDGFTLMQLQGINGGLIHYGDKTIRMVSQVCQVFSLQTSYNSLQSQFSSQPGECPVVLEWTQEDEDTESNAAILPVQSITVGSSYSKSYSAGPVCFS